jgi:DNA-binding NarL/FixJ family response regulator
LRSGLSRPLRVLVVESSWWWSHAFLHVLEREVQQFDPVGVAEVAQARRLLSQQPPDLVTVDLEVPEAAELMRELAEAGVARLATGLSPTPAQLSLLLATGTSFLTKPQIDPERLPELLRLVARGDGLLLQANRSALARLVDDAVEDSDGVARLTKRETEVLALIGQGLTNAEIAKTLYLAPSSVKKLVSRLFQRLGVRNRTEAALLAHREGLLS